MVYNFIKIEIRQILISILFGGEGGIRTHGTLARTPIFKTGALNQLDHLSMWLVAVDKKYINI